ncbi:ATP-binding cassette domain-containing protein [Meridianimarinicoccus aquatilis]|nr:ATP-binding cassette domain-containing protein [Fluviibacterium aquatile]
MEFVTVVHRAILSSGRWVYVYVALSSLGTLGVAILVNTVTDYDPVAGPDYELFAAFILVCAITVVSRGETTRIMNAVGEGIAHHMRIQYARLLKEADLVQVEMIGQEKIKSTLARNAQILAESPAVLTQGVASAVTFVLATIYVATLSLMAAVLVVALTAIVVLASRFRTQKAREAMAVGQAAERRFFDSFNSLLDGLPEARMDRNRSEDLFKNFLTVRAVSARSARLQALDSMIAFGVLVFASFYLLLGSVTFITPQYVDSAATAMKIVYVSSVIWLLIEGLLRIMPTILRGDAAFTELRKLERQLKDIQHTEIVPSLSLPPFESLALNQLSYTYPTAEGGSDSFSIGPCDLTLSRGEIVFIVGGNGSGKTTLLRNLCRLYEPTSGAVFWNGMKITAANAISYRQHISAIFASFHLFDRLYGHRDIPKEAVDSALDYVGLGGKTSYVDGKFTTLNLSTGQRKRLALAIAILEDRDIMVFDEIAAEQDPEFRRRIYEEILPDLKAKGHAVLVISHDERYFSQADRLYFMEEGQLSLRSA